MRQYYQFNEQDALDFARYTGYSIKQVGNELFFKTCPYCRSSKDRDKFSINLKTGQFQCKRASCGAKGNMITLAKDFNWDGLSTEVRSYYNLDRKQFRTFALPKGLTSRNEAVEYLQSRGISKEITERYKITVKKDTNNILVFPFLDTTDSCITIKYRKTDFDKTKDKNKEWFEPNCKPILFGMAQCADNGTLVITEGQIDSLSVAEAGIPNAVSVPNGAKGFSWVPHCWDWVSEFKEIIVFGDCENGKVTLAEELKARFTKKNIKVVRIRDYQGCKDANELLRAHGKDAIINAVNNAEQISSDLIIGLENCKSEDPEKTPAVSTGIYELDKVMSGGYRPGELIIVTGKRGQGKSTFVSQEICNILNHHITEDGKTVYPNKVFIYSGEMTNSTVKRWIDRQLIGGKDLQEWEINRVNAWYAGRIYAFDNTNIGTIEEVEVLEVAETAIEKYGCNFIIIDNLMTALDSGSADLYKMQAAFAKKVAIMARKYEVTIILISHPRKGNVDDFDNDFISGSGDITNNANYVFCYQQLKDMPADQRTLIVSKNRLTGKLAVGPKALKLKYSEDSKRIVDINSEFSDIHYGWRPDAEPEWDQGFLPTDDAPF
ncbi:MAG: AAA family ATPase [Bacteroidaceae bacterium]|nr:AAA family ATPase [Bacteroidaceae bacterium]